MRSEPTIVSETHGPVFVIRINNPKQKNSLNADVLAGLALELEAIRARQDIAAIVFTGAADVFASGADINELRRLTLASATEFANRGQRIFQDIADARQLTIAAINGYCIGGGLDLALACDLRFASASALFRHPGATLGIITGWGGTQRLPRLIGTALTLELFTTARSLRSAEAYKLGLITRIADPVLECALEVAREFAARQASLNP
ncbi:MAG TPA: enoyl-CoA hydratase/isomerase family protein [Pyrinomonadaceae bacterium]|jgi:enoyl-CoA hydratase